MRMTPNRFEHLFFLVGHRIEKRTTRIRKPISAPQRLALSLHYLATGESQQSLSLSYSIGKSTVCQIASEIALAIYNSLKNPYIFFIKDSLVFFKNSINCWHPLIVSANKR